MKRALALGAFALVVLVLLAALQLPQQSGALRAAFLDVGQGDAIFIESPTGVQVVIDGGPDASVVEELSGVMPWWDRTIDALIVTNPDQDHFAGFLDVLERYAVARVFESGTAKDSATYRALERKIGEEGAQRIIPMRGDVIDLGAGAQLRILFPDRDVSGLDSNPGSLIMQLTYGSTTALLTGDTIESVEDFVVALDGSALESQILKLGHHGSRTSSGERLLDAVSPKVAVVSAGCDNSYGHPHKEVVDRLAARQVPYLWTCKEGTIKFTSDGKSWAR